MAWKIMTFSLPAVRDRWTILAAALEAALWAACLVALGVAGWMWLDGKLYQVRSHAEIVRAAEVGRAAETEAAETAEANIALPPAEGDPIGLIGVPRLGMSPVVVAEGFSNETLRRAVGHLPSTALPGEAGNVVLAGHRDTFFRPLEGIVEGDRVVLESGGVAYEYEVEWTKVVEPTAVEVIEDAGYPALTLITCFPFRYVGNAPQRFIVRAKRVGGK